MASEIELSLDRKEYRDAGRLMSSFMALYEEAEEIYRLYVKNTLV
jgi:hypothetical protein